MFGSSDFKPVTPPISVFPGYVRKETTVLAMSENMMSMSGVSSLLFFGGCIH
jgi:hypothetical protein